MDENRKYAQTFVVATPFLAGLTGLLYVDQRIRRERYDLQLATWAAGR